MRTQHIVLFLHVALLVLAQSKNPAWTRPSVSGPTDDPLVRETFNAILRRAQEYKGMHRDRRRDQHLRQFTAPPFTPEPDINPHPAPIPEGALTLKFGRTLPNTEGNPETPFGYTSEQGFRTAKYIINSNGGVMLNDTPHFIEWITYNDGADCNTMLLLYEHLIVTDQCVVLFSSVNFICSYVALVAEAYGVPYLNSADYTLPILMDSVPPYNSLQWIWDGSADFRTAGGSCAVPTYNAGARTYAVFYDIQDAFFGPTADSGSEAAGMKRVLNTTILDIPLALASYGKNGNCSYMDTYIEQLIKAKPDLVIGTFLTETDIFLDCMHRKLYHPPAFWLFTGSDIPASDTKNVWQAYGTLGGDIWDQTANYSDPYLVSTQFFVQAFIEIFKDSATAQNGLGYQASHGQMISAACYAINKAQSTEPEDIAAELNAMNITMVSGLQYLQAGSRHFYHPYVCLQTLGSNPDGSAERIEIYPYVEGRSKPVQYPWNFTYPKAFLNSLPKMHSGPTRVQWGLIGMGIAIFVLILVAIVVALVVNRRYHTIFIAKKEAAVDTWNE